MIDSIRQQTFKESTIHSAWRALCLMPCNTTIVKSKLREIPNPSAQVITSPSVSQLHPTIPPTISTLKWQGDELLHEAVNYAPAFRKKIKSVLQGALAEAQSEAQALEHMVMIRAAEEARSASRRGQNRRHVQKDGFFIPQKDLK